MDESQDVSASEDDLARVVGDPLQVRKAFDALPSIAMCVQGPELRCVATSALLRESVGRRSFIGQPLREVFAEAEQQGWIQLYEQVYATGQSQSHHEYRLQVESEDGELIELFVDFVMTPTFGPDGEVTGVLGTSTDVTERARARRAAEQQAGEAERRFEQARDVVLALQAELMSTDLPVLPGVQFSASYLLAEADTAAGGDWFDAFPVGEGRVALVVGDVVGHGVTASATMGQLRVVLRERLEATGDMSAAVASLDRLARSMPYARAATVCVALLDPARGSLEYCTAGHPPPLVVPAAGGAARYLPASGGGPLGVDAEHPLARAELGDGEVLLLYTDGILERPGVTHDEGAEELAQVAADVAAERVFRGDAPSPVERLTTQTLELLTRMTGHADDITLIAAARRRVDDGLDVEVPATTAGYGEVRHALLGWLTALDATPRDISLLDLAVTELAANVVEHAYPPGEPGTIGLHATLGQDGEATVVVTDRGIWRTPGPPPPTSGRGLWMAGEAVDCLTLDRKGGVGREGTRATIRHRLRRPGLLGTPSGFARGEAGPSPFDVSVDEGPPRRLTARGSLDVATATEFADRLSIFSRGGMHPVVVDLTGVDALTSAAVTALFDARASHATHGHELTLVTTPGSAPARVLDLVGLTHNGTG